MTEKELRERIQNILDNQRIITLSINDEEGPWAVPVFYASSGFDLYFVSNPNSRHGKAAQKQPHFAGAVFNPLSVWREIQGLQIFGKVSVPDEEKEIEQIREIYVKKYPFTDIFFKTKDTLPPPLAAKITDVCFFTIQPIRITLVDNTIHFGFHHVLDLNA